MGARPWCSSRARAPWSTRHSSTRVRAPPRRRGRGCFAGGVQAAASPYSFQGMGREGLRLLRAAADRYGLGGGDGGARAGCVARSPNTRTCCRSGRATCRTRHSSARSAARAARAAEAGDERDAGGVAPGGRVHRGRGERGNRALRAWRAHVQSASRNLLDLAAVPLLRARTSLPIAVDPSHGVGVRAAIASMALAAVAAGADAVMIECHPEPGTARSDGFQALDPAELEVLGGPDAGGCHRRGPLVEERRSRADGGRAKRRGACALSLASLAACGKEAPRTGRAAASTAPPAPERAPRRTLRPGSVGRPTPHRVVYRGAPREAWRRGRERLSPPLRSGSAALRRRRDARVDGLGRGPGRAP